MNNEEQWIKEMRKHLEDYSEPLPQGLWEEIEKDLSTPKIIPYKRFWQAAAVILVLLASSLSVWFWSTPTADFTSQENIVPKIAETSGKQSETENICAPHTLQVTQLAQNTADHLIYNSLQPMKSCSMSVPESNELPETKYQEQEPKKQSGQDGMETKTFAASRSAKTSRNADRRQMQKNAEALQYKKNGEQKKISFGVNMGNTPYSSTNNYQGMGRLAIYSPSRVMDLMGAANDKQIAYSQVLFENSDLNPATHIHHHIPVTVGATFRWEFSQCWSLETGVMYTLLVSELNSGENAYVEEEQRLHYVGIPLKIQRSIWKNNRFNIYASAGGAMEKCVSGEIETKYVSASGWKEKENNSLDVKQLQWSVTAGVGAQVNFTPQVGLYVEPGVAYYFDDKSMVETIRKEHPLNFNLQLGLRFSIKK